MWRRAGPTAVITSSGPCCTIPFGRFPHSGTLAIMRILLIALAAVCLNAADTKVGKPLTLKAPVTVDALLAKPDGYVGKTVQVKGKITEVCQAMGCWMNLVGESGKTVHVEVPHNT